MWKCARCETNNPDNSNICVVCDNMHKQVIAANKNTVTVNDKSGAIVPKRKFSNFFIPYEICFMVTFTISFLGFIGTGGYYFLPVVMIIISPILSYAVGFGFLIKKPSVKTNNSNKAVVYDTTSKRTIRSIITFVIAFCLFDLLVPFILLAYDFDWELMGVVIILLSINIILCTVQAAQKMK